MGRNTYLLSLKKGADPNTFVVEVADKPFSVTLLEANGQVVRISLSGERFSFQRPAPAVVEPKPGTPAASAQKGVVASPMPGKVIGTLVKKGEKVRAGDPLVIIESMKMEIAVRSDRDGEVEETLVAEGAAVKRGQALVKLRG